MSRTPIRRILLAAALVTAPTAGAVARADEPPTARTAESQLPRTTGADTFPGYRNPDTRARASDEGFTPPNPFSSGARSGDRTRTDRSPTSTGTDRSPSAHEGAPAATSTAPASGATDGSRSDRPRDEAPPAARSPSP